MSDLNVFAFDSRAVRVVMVDGQPWLVAAKDVQNLDALAAGDVHKLDATDPKWSAS